MKYIVPSGEAEHLFPVSELGLMLAKEFAIASNSQVILEKGNGKEIVFPIKQLIKTHAK